MLSAHDVELGVPVLLPAKEDAVCFKWLVTCGTDMIPEAGRILDAVFVEISNSAVELR